MEYEEVNRSMLLGREGEGAAAHSSTNIRNIKKSARCECYRKRQDQPDRKSSPLACVPTGYSSRYNTLLYYNLLDMDNGFGVSNPCKYIFRTSYYFCSSNVTPR